MPLNRAGSTLSVAVADPTNMAVLDDLRFLTGLHVQIVLASFSAIERAHVKYYPEDGGADGAEVLAELGPQFELSEETAGIDESYDLGHLTHDSPVVRVVNFILLRAISVGASDIHIEPFETVMRVRFRIDGKLREVFRPPITLKWGIPSRIKVMCKCDVAERRVPQDGRFAVKLKDGRKIGFRVSLQPVIWGEKVVLRILDKGNLTLDIQSLGFDPPTLKSISTALAAPFGMMLVTGPTGSGKTTTLYSLLNSLNDEETNISTVEDPVEYNMYGINQVQVHDDAGMTFAKALRSFLRQDPDVILVGEIRDFETAEISVKAAFTGHIVLSTLHTNDAPSTISRMLNMGIEPFNVAAAVIMVLAQRLVRRICKSCVAAMDVPPDALRELGIPAAEIGSFGVFHGAGCEQCSNGGYRGRAGIYEGMTITDALRSAILNGAPTDELKARAVLDGMTTLRMSALQKMREGMTTIEEVLRLTVADKR